jgi:hypothetical protein
MGYAVHMGIPYSTATVSETDDAKAQYFSERNETPAPLVFFFFFFESAHPGDPCRVLPVAGDERQPYRRAEARPLV